MIGTKGTSVALEVGFHIEDPSPTVPVNGCTLTIKNSFGKVECEMQSTGFKFQDKANLNYIFNHIEHYVLVLKSGDYVIGSCKASMDDIFESKGFQVTSDKEKVCTLVATSRVLQNMRVMEMQIKCNNIEKKDNFSKTDGFFVVRRLSGEEKIYVSETITDSDNPEWKMAKIKLSNLFNGKEFSLEDRFLIDFYDEDVVSKDFIGSITVSLADVIKGKSMELINEKKKKSTYKNSGMISISGKISMIKPFSQFIQEGMRFQFELAVDLSNNEQHGLSPHYLSPYGAFNDFQTAIQVFGGIMTIYGKKEFNMFGFGLDSDSVISKCADVYEALKCYSEWQQVSGPSNLAPVIKNFGEKTSDSLKVLIILSSGNLNDYEETNLEIAKLAGQPAFVVILGVGNFEKIKKLETDSLKIIRLQESFEKNVLNILKKVAKFANNLK